MQKLCLLLSLIFSGTVMACAQRPEGQRPMLPVQLALDANQDNAISAEEITKAPSALRKLDKNGDGQLSEEEVRPNFERRGAGGAADNATESIVNGLLEFDENKDGKLTKSELPERMQGLFARGDSDKDEVLTKAELQKIAEAQSPSAQDNSGANNGRAGERDEHNERGEREGRRGAGGMLRRIPLMAALDANGDGIIAADEISNASTALKTLDKNEDGQLSEDELRPQGGRGFGREQREGERPQRRP